jgi:hypothetical protein
MLEAFRLGGWGMVPTAIIGLVCVVAAVQYARRPATVNLLATGVLAVATLLAGGLGFVTGLIRTLRVATSGELPEPVQTVIAAGVGESLHNVGLALALLVFAAVAVAIGARRAGPREVDARAGRA